MKFFAELAEADATDLPSITATRNRKPRRRTNSKARQREIDAANDVLRRAGILIDNNVQPSATLLSGSVR